MPKKKKSKQLLKNWSKKRPDYKYPKKQLQIGTKIEMEHTTSRYIAQNIAKDHLDEDRKYYTKLKKCRL